MQSSTINIITCTCGTQAKIWFMNHNNFKPLTSRNLSTDIADVAGSGASGAMPRGISYVQLTQSVVQTLINPGLAFF